MRTWGQSKISSYCICACLLLRLKSRSTKGHLTIQLLWAAAQILVTRFLPCLPSGRVLLCVWCESGELEGRTSSRFSCVTPVVETFSSDRVAFRTSSNISDGTPLQKQQKSSKYRLFPEKKTLPQTSNRIWNANVTGEATILLFIDFFLFHFIYSWFKITRFHKKVFA